MRASWVCERSAPDDLEERLLAAGCHRDDDDYLHAAMVLTREPARVEGVEARRLETPDERLEALAVQQAVFGVDVTSEPEYAAWVDGRIAAVGRTIWTRVGRYLIGGAGVGRRRSRSAPGRCRGRSSSGSASSRCSSSVGSNPYALSHERAVPALQCRDALRPRLVSVPALQI